MSVYRRRILYEKILKHKKSVHLYLLLGLTVDYCAAELYSKIDGIGFVRLEVNEDSMWFCINYSIRHFAAIIFPSSFQPKHFWILFTKLPFSIAIRSNLLQRKRKHMLAMYMLARSQ